MLAPHTLLPKHSGGRAPDPPERAARATTYERSPAWLRVCANVRVQLRPVPTKPGLQTQLPPLHEAFGSQVCAVEDCLRVHGALATGGSGPISRPPAQARWESANCWRAYEGLSEK